MLARGFTQPIVFTDTGALEVDVDVEPVATDAERGQTVPLPDIKQVSGLTVIDAFCLLSGRLVRSRNIRGRQYDLG